MVVLSNISCVGICAAVTATGIAAMLTLAPAAHAEQRASSAESQIKAAHAASKELGEALKTQLVAALKSGGAIAALSVCNTVAPSIAANLSQQRNMQVGRTALKVRNSANAPDAFETRVLEDFAKKMAAGADPATLEYAETVIENGASSFRYMKAIPMAAEPCAACHGTDIKPDVKAAVDQLYPQDQATGFKPGELRGAFTIRQTIK